MKIILLSIPLLWSVVLTAQTLTGNLKHHAGQHISLTGFNYYNNYELAKTTVDSLGNFTLNYPKAYNGMAILSTQDNSSLVLLLTEPNIQLTGTHLQDPDGLSFKNSIANTNFVHYAKAQGLRNNVMSALQYLDNVYQKEQLFTKRKKIKKAIKEEQAYIIKEDAVFVVNLDKESYLRWFIPYRKLVQDMPTIVRKQTHRIPEAIQQFRATDFNQPNFKTSGLFRDIIEAHYLLLENMGQALDSVYTQMNLSTDYLIDNLKQNDSVLNNVSKELFKLFEKRSLFKVAAHLSEKLLSSEDCACFIEQDLQKKMQKYVTLKVGNIAPDIQLTTTKKLSHLKQNVLLVFGSSTCPTCKKDALQLMEYYVKWKENKTPLEVVYISLDTDQATFNTAFKDVPWPSYCDFKGWDMQAAKDYYVNAIPTYLLLDKDQTILLHPRSIAHVNAWITHRLK